MRYMYSWSLPRTYTTLNPRGWPPAEGIMGFWADANGDINVLVDAPSIDAADAVIQRGWHIATYDLTVSSNSPTWLPEADKFPPPAWSVSLGRWSFDD